MFLFPAIDLYDGKAVRLLKGEYDKMTIYSEHPEEIAEDFYNQGARHIHIVDLEGAKDGTTANFDVVKAIIEKTDMKVEIGGGIRTDDVIKKYIDAGVARVILGTAAVKDTLFNDRPGFVADSLAFIPFSGGDSVIMASTIKKVSGVNVPLFEAKMPYKSLLRGLDNQLRINLDAEQEDKGHYKGLMVGSIDAPNNNAGNWE